MSHIPEDTQARLMEMRARLVEEQNNVARRKYTPMYVESCATCAWEPGPNCSRACKHHPRRELKAVS